MRLTTWPEVQRHLAATYDDVKAEPDGVLSVVPLRAAGAGRSAPLQVTRAEVLGATWIEVASVVGSLRYRSQMELLAEGAQLTIGTFCTRDGALVVRQMLPLAGLDVADLDETIRDLVELATRARERMAQTGVPVAPWTLPGARGR